jgi:hypothetical protein
VGDFWNRAIRELTVNGTNWVVSTIAGTPLFGAGQNDGPAAFAQFNTPSGIAVDVVGNVYVADSGNNTMRKLTLSGGHWMVNTVAGVSGMAGSADGIGNQAYFSGLTSLAVDSAGGVSIADTGNNTIRRGIFLQHPVLSWTPVNIAYGAPLGSNQLNASANVPGAYVYTPTNGTVLNAGSNTLSVTFIPTDNMDYTTVTKTVTLLVANASLVVTASNASRLYGQANPAFTGSIIGLTNNDSIALGPFVCAASNTSPPGPYPITPTLTDTNNRVENYSVTTNFGTLTVIPPPGQLVENGGFETGDFSFWTLSGNDILTGKFANVFVSTNYLYAHSGQYGAQLGPILLMGYLSQALPTTAGQRYLVSLWLDSPVPTGSGINIPNEFTVVWDGTVLFHNDNLGESGWTNLQFNPTATTTNTLLQIGFSDDPFYFGLDDVKVLPLPDLQTVTHSGSTITFSWIAVPGSLYQIQSATNLAAANWTNFGDVITATSYQATASDSISTTQQFYRIVFMP